MTIATHSFDIALVDGFRNSRAPLGDPVTPPTGDTDLSVLRAFPGAEGGGSLSIGGRGGTVIEVTNLSDSGAGSFREAVTASGPRIVIFRVGGTIELLSNIEIRNPYLTIAGQTAPGGGIVISGRYIQGWTSDPCKGLSPLVFWSGAHDIIVRNIRIRKGLHDPECRGSASVLSVGANVYNLMFDSLSLSWGNDQTFGGWAWGSPGPRKITLQNCIHAEMQEGHAVGPLIGANSPTARESMEDVDIFRNYFVGLTHRLPAIGVKTGRFINNIVFGWASRGATNISPGMQADIIGNKYFRSPAGSISDAEIRTFTVDDTCLSDVDREMSGPSSIYLEGNSSSLYPGIGPSDDNWPMTKLYKCSFGGDIIADPVPAEYQRFTPLAPVGGPITQHPTSDLETVVLPHVGDARGLSSNGYWVSRRDAQDERVINWYSSNTRVIIPGDKDFWQSQGLFLDKPDSFFGTSSSHADRLERWAAFGELYNIWENPANGTPYSHSGDGIADAWKARNGFSITENIGSQLVPGLSGWTYLDLFLSGLDLP